MKSGSSTLILGGGFGGIVTARTLRAALPPEHEIRLVSRIPTFQLGTTKTWVMLGHMEPEQVTRPLDVLARAGIEVEINEVRRIDPARRRVTTANGERAADYLVVALGAGLDPSVVPGLDSAAETFYTREGAVRLRGVLREFRGGRVVILIPKAPFQCPPGPYEGAMLLASHFEERGLRDKTQLDVHTIEKAPMATAGPEIGKFVVERLRERGIGFHPQRQVERVDGAGKAVHFQDGTSAPYDLLIAIPPHVAPAAARESGLTGPSGWIPVDPRTLAMGGGADPLRVFAIGDATSVPLPGRFAPEAPLALPKAGVFAEGQGIAVAGRIAAHVLGREPDAVFDGRGYCYIEVGSGLALRGDGSFFDLPHPTMVPQQPDPTQLAEKRAWVDRWMETYL